MNEPVLFFAGYLLLKYLKLIINVFRDWASVIRQQYVGIILTDFRENRLYLIKYLDIYIGVKNASGKCNELFFPQKPPNRPQINF